MAARVDIQRSQNGPNFPEAVFCAPPQNQFFDTPFKLEPYHASHHLGYQLRT
jgi:hypothetical protein